MKKVSLFITGLLAYGLSYGVPCVPPGNTSCLDAEEVTLTCNLCDQGSYTYYTQCTPAPSYLPPASNAPQWMVPDDEVWFRFTAPRTVTGASSNNSKITFTVVGNCEMDPVIELYRECPSNPPGPAQGLAWGDGSNVAKLDATLDACQTYLFRVYHSGIDGGNYQFDLQIRAKSPDNDQCTSPYSLATNNTWVRGTNVGSTGPMSAIGCNTTSHNNITGTTYDDDVWFSFVAPSEHVKVEVQSVSQCVPWLSQNFDPTMALFDSNPCTSGANAVKCINDVAGTGTESYVFSCLESGDTYYIRVADYNAINCQVGAEFEIRATSVSCAAPPNDEFEFAQLLNEGWQGYSNEGIEESNTAGVDPNVIRAHEVVGTHNATLTCATFNTSLGEPSLGFGVNSSTGQTVWYRFMAPEYCEGDVILHTNGPATDFNTAIAVYETLPGYTDDLMSSTPTGIGSTDPYSMHLNTAPIATSNDWPTSGGSPLPSTTSDGTIPSDPCGLNHGSFSVASGSTNSYIKLDFGPGGTLTPGEFYFVQVYAVPASGQTCVAGNIDLFFQVDRPMFNFLGVSNSVTPGKFQADISWGCSGTAPDNFLIRKSGSGGPYTEPDVECGASSDDIHPKIIAWNSGLPYQSTIDGLDCGQEYEVWIVYEGTHWDNRTTTVSGNRRNSQATYSYRFSTPACAKREKPDLNEQQSNASGLEGDRAITVYPNPNGSDRLQVNYQFSDSPGKLVIEIMTIEGKLVKRHVERGIDQEAGNINFDIGNLSTGNYIVRVKSNSDVFVEKLMVE